MIYEQWIKKSRKEGKKQEEKEKLPEIRRTFYFSRHLKPEDLVKAQPLISKADIVCPELAGWTVKNEQDFQDVADGKKKPGECEIKVDHQEFMNELLMLMYNTGKKIAMCDIEAETAFQKEKIKQEGELLSIKGILVFLMGMKQEVPKKNLSIY